MPISGTVAPSAEEVSANNQAVVWWRADLLGSALLLLLGSAELALLVACAKEAYLQKLSGQLYSGRFPETRGSPWQL
jgi:hypothetical protein